MNYFERLDVWQVAHQMTLDIYEATAVFPATERYGLASQLRRAAVSVGSNIAEGSERGSDRDYARFLMMARASYAEVRYQLRLSHDLGYLDVSSCRKLSNDALRVQKMLTRLADTLDH